MKNISKQTCKALSGIILCSSALLGASVHAKPTTTGETYTPNPQAFQQVCHGKAEATPVSLALNGVIFNGTCQVMLVPSNPKANTGVEDAALTQACAGKKAGENVTAAINGQDLKGKCLLSFHSIEPDAGQ